HRRIAIAEAVTRRRNLAAHVVDITFYVCSRQSTSERITRNPGKVDDGLIDVERFGWADCELEAIQWAEGGRDLLLTVRVQSTDDAPLVRRVVRCSWVDDVDIKLVQGREQPSQPLSWAASVKHRANGRIELHFDFASMGDVRLCCSEIEVSVPEAPPK
ncbi:MAG TPA: hypothetical protein VF407_08380, partial [Polyangiaceae bacterium]